jgi:hypothetical protein
MALEYVLWFGLGCRWIEQPPESYIQVGGRHEMDMDLKETTCQVLSRVSELVAPESLAGFPLHAFEGRLIELRKQVDMIPSTE